MKCYVYFYLPFDAFWNFLNCFIYLSCDPHNTHDLYYLGNQLENLASL